MNYILRTLDINWNDEFNTIGMKLYTEHEHKLLVKALESIKNEQVEWSFGTNEAQCATIEEFCSNTEIQVLSGKEAMFISVLFPGINKYGIGQCSDIEFLTENFDTIEITKYWKCVDD